MGKRKALLIGAGGFGRAHFNELLRLQREGALDLAAVCDVKLTDEAARVIGEQGIRHYSDYRHMLDAERGADFVVVSTPIQLHAPMSIHALEAGYHVLLEKPPAAAIQDVDRILAAARRSGKLCAVNFFTPSASAKRLIKQIAASGEIGRLQSIKGLSLLLRTEQYFKRTPWAGKLTTSNAVVLDGAFHNPAAHLLYSMLNLAEMLAEDEGGSVEPVRITAEMYHANPIESDDTTAMRIEMSDGTNLCFYVTLCARHTETQRIRIEGAKGNLEWDYRDRVTIWRNGVPEHHDCSEGGLLEQRYRNLLRVMDGIETRLDVPLESARLFTLAANGAFESSGTITAIPAPYLYRSSDAEEPGAYIEGIESTIKEAFAAGKLFSEMGVPWSEASEPFDLQGYRCFPQRFRMNGIHFFKKS